MIMYSDPVRHPWKWRKIHGPRITVAVASLNQGRFLEAALTSILSQPMPIEVFVADGGSSDCTLEVLARFEDRLAGWRSHPDAGQAAAINECIAHGTAPYATWLNSDDLYLNEGLALLLKVLEANVAAPAAYGVAWNVNAAGVKLGKVWTQQFDASRLAVRCIVSQPASLIRREVWESLGGLDTKLEMAFDYDLWWRILRAYGPLLFVDREIACNRQHPHTKTRLNRLSHYREAVAVVRRHYGQVPWKWWLLWPYAVWWRGLLAQVFRGPPH